MRLHKGDATMTFKYKSGALTSSVEIIGLSQELKSQDSITYYGNKHFICESITYSQALGIASALNMFMNRLTQDYEIPNVIKE